MPTKIRAHNSLMNRLVCMEACEEAQEWVERKHFTTWKQIYDNCKRGDWLMWLLIKIKIPAPYGANAVIALEQGFCTELYSDCWGKSLMEAIDDPVYHYGDANISHVVADKIYNYVWENYNDSYIIRDSHVDKLNKECCNRIRKMVPWGIVRDALDKWFKENYC